MGLLRLGKPHEWLPALYALTADRDGAKPFALLPRGLLMARVPEDSAAHRGGLRAGDVIWRANGVRVLNKREFAGVMRALPKGTRSVPMVVARAGVTDCYQVDYPVPEPKPSGEFPSHMRTITCARASICMYNALTQHVACVCIACILLAYSAAELAAAAAAKERADRLAREAAAREEAARRAREEEAARARQQREEEEKRAKAKAKREAEQRRIEALRRRKQEEKAR